MDENEVTSPLVGVSIRQTARLHRAARSAEKYYSVNGKLVAKSTYFRHKQRAEKTARREARMLPLDLLQVEAWSAFTSHI